MPRDSRRSKLYKADQSISTFGLQRDALGTVEAMQAYVDKLQDSAWFQRRWPSKWGRRMTVRPGKGHRHASAAYYTEILQMPLWARKESVLLHEVAHIATHRKYGSDVAAHGREYAAIYLELVRHQMGDEAWKTLRQAFVQNRVLFRKKREMSEDAKAILRERMVEVRAARSRS